MCSGGNPGSSEIILVCSGGNPEGVQRVSLVVRI